MRAKEVNSIDLYKNEKPTRSEDEGRDDGGSNE